MKKITEKITTIFEKMPIVAYILNSFIRCFFIAIGLIAVLFAIFWGTGIYANLEARLDLKYNSSIIIAPMCLFAALFVMSFLLGFVMYIYKYKRRRKQTEFFKAVAPALEHK